MACKAKGDFALLTTVLMCHKTVMSDDERKYKAQKHKKNCPDWARFFTPKLRSSEQSLYTLFTMSKYSFVVSFLHGAKLKVPETQIYTGYFSVHSHHLVPQHPPPD